MLKLLNTMTKIEPWHCSHASPHYHPQPQPQTCALKSEVFRGVQGHAPWENWFSDLYVQFKTFEAPKRLINSFKTMSVCIILFCQYLLSPHLHLSFLSMSLSCPSSSPPKAELIFVCVTEESPKITPIISPKITPIISHKITLIIIIRRSLIALLFLLFWVFVR